MHTLLLKILANEIAKGNKPSRTFKPASFALVAKSISEKFEVESDHVENHLRTIKNMWTIIRVALDVIKIWRWLIVQRRYMMRKWWYETYFFNYSSYISFKALFKLCSFFSS